jgi:L-lactate dehydrogenase complex protein LldF
MKEGYGPVSKSISMKGMAWVLSNPSIYRFAGKFARLVMRLIPSMLGNKYFNPWYKQREMPAPPKESFREWYLKNKN